VFERLKARGEEVFTQISGELMSNPHFVKAMQAAMQGKEKLDRAAAEALKNLNIPTRSEFKKAVHRIEALERELAELKAAVAQSREGTPKRPRKRAPSRKT
jgi:polyhydroxyalkanoate synthesis regulator phasin